MNLTTVWMTAVLCGVLLAAPANAGKGNGKGSGDSGADGGGGEIPVCVGFRQALDGGSDRVGSDLAIDGVAEPYCHDKRAKIAAIVDNNGNLGLDTNTSSKAGVGRSVFASFADGPGAVPVVPPGGTTLVSTLDLDAQGIPHDAVLAVGVFRPDVDLRAMAPGETRDDVNVRLSIFFEGEMLFIRWDPGTYNTDPERSCPPNPDGADATFVELTCEAASAGQCSEWTIRALPAATASEADHHVACLGFHGGGEGPQEFYSMPFVATVVAAP